MNHKSGSCLEQATIFVGMRTFFVRSAVMLEKTDAACYRETGVKAEERRRQ